MSEFAEMMVNNMKDRSVESVTQVIDDSFNTGFVVGTVYTAVGIIGVTAIAVGGKALYTHYRSKKTYKELQQIHEELLKRLED